ncbi:hypothetical protein Aargi30884_15340 [Amedibacterium intestinale]|uniref:Uncharacterized protein n=1 Tax=Amedibacterium intestinale TaxID=2583452 RepID=A0A6N4TJ80_9FIRM|nr:hypothetical protein Aargi30884_15340 [Amedibacterium intestinale]
MRGVPYFFNFYNQKLHHLKRAIIYVCDKVAEMPKEKERIAVLSFYILHHCLKDSVTSLSFLFCHY